MKIDDAATRWLLAATVVMALIGAVAGVGGCRHQAPEGDPPPRERRLPDRPPEHTPPPRQPVN
jgi:hypothetical protein